MNIDRNRVIRCFAAYVRDFDRSDAGIVLKYHHSIRVSRIIEKLAHGIYLSDADTDLAWCIGVLHDIGRFEQLREYHTFIDYRSVDHARYGAHYLFDEGHIRDFLSDASEDSLIRLAVEQHNVFRLPDGLTPRQKQFCQLIRDADKIDIFRVYVTQLAGTNNIWHTDLSRLKTQSVSESVMAQARRMRTIRTEDKKTRMDFYVGVLCLYFELAYPVSRQLADEQGYYDTLLQFHSQNQQTEEGLDEIRHLAEQVRKQQDRDVFK